jgi:glutamate-1-semialdehyde 2,1-aminomutase
MVIAESKIFELAETAYRARTPKSSQLFETAKTVLPGGDTRSVLYFSPYPTFVNRGSGCRVWDVDNNEHIDFLNNYTALVHGHAHPAIVEAVCNQVKRGTAFASPTESQIELAKRLQYRMPSVEQVRFCNSGSEATLMAIRAAKAFTGRNKVLKLDGGYHGLHDAAIVNTASTARTSKGASPDEQQGVFRGIVTDVVSIPANDLESAAQAFEMYQDNLAAVIVEPVMGAAGMIPLEPAFLNYVAEASRSTRAVLIFDEVITMRLAYGGAQQIYRLRPDLTTMGKLIGGGLPVGAFGGRAAIMTLFDPAAARLHHSGTFNANPATLAAGIAALDLSTEETISHINQLGERLRSRLREVIERYGIDAQLTGIGSLIGIHFTRDPIRNYQDALEAPRSLLSVLHVLLLNRGIMTAPRGLFCTSTVMSESEIAQFVDAFEDSIIAIKQETQA